MIDMIQAAGAAAGAVVIAAFLYVNAFVKHKNARTEEYLENIIAGGDACDWKFEKSKTWYHGYSVALVALIISAGFIGWFAPSVISMKIAVPEDLAPLVSFIGAVVGGLFVDYFLLHPAADGLFFAKVEEPLLRSFLEPPVPEEVAEEPDEAEPVQEAAATDTDKLMEAAQLILDYLKK